MRLSRKAIYALIGIIVLLAVAAVYRGYQINADEAAKTVSIRELEPTSGATGTELLIRGQGMLSSDNTVTFGTAAVTGLKSDDGTSLLVYIPNELKPGDYTVSVKNSLGQSNSSTYKVTEK